MTGKIGLKALEIAMEVLLGITSLYAFITFLIENDIKYGITAIYTLLAVVLLRLDEMEDEKWAIKHYLYG